MSLASKGKFSGENHPMYGKSISPDNLEKLNLTPPGSPGRCEQLEVKKYLYILKTLFQIRWNYINLLIVSQKHPNFLIAVDKI